MNISHRLPRRYDINRTPSPAIAVWPGNGLRQSGAGLLCERPTNTG